MDISDNGTLKGKSDEKLVAEKSPAFQFYPKDLLSDGDATALRTHMLGSYMVLLAYDWTDGGLRDDDRILKRLGRWEGVEGDAEWHEFREFLAKKFLKHPTKPGYITSRRLQKERWNQSVRKSKAQEAANQRWHPNDDLPADANASSKHRPSICKTHAKRCPSSSSSSSTAIIPPPTLVGGDAPPPKPEKIEFAPRISMTQNCHDELIKQFGAEAVKFYLPICSDHLANAKPKKDCAAYMRNWIRKDQSERKGFFYGKHFNGSAGRVSQNVINQQMTMAAVKSILEEEYETE